MPEPLEVLGWGKGTKGKKTRRTPTLASNSSRVARHSHAGFSSEFTEPPGQSSLPAFSRWGKQAQRELTQVRAQAGASGPEDVL